MKLYKFRLPMGHGFIALTIPSDSFEDAMWLALEVVNHE